MSIDFDRILHFLKFQTEKAFILKEINASCRKINTDI